MVVNLWIEKVALEDDTVRVLAIKAMECLDEQFHNYVTPKICHPNASDLNS